MIGNWERWGKEPAIRFLDSADAYLVASIRTCWEMSSDKGRQTWAHASVVQLLLAHSIELFLKGALLSRNSPFPKTHDLRMLVDAYKGVFPEPKFRFDVPFIPEPIDFSSEQIENAMEARVEPSMEHRYPFDKNGNEWASIAGFTPEGFGHVLWKVDADYGRLMPLLGGNRVGAPLYAPQE